MKKNEFLNKDEYILTLSWTPSPSPNIVAYRIYSRGKVIAQIPATNPLFFSSCFSKKLFSKFIFITAVNANNVESAPMGFNQMAITPNIGAPSPFNGVIVFNPLPD